MDTTYLNGTIDELCRSPKTSGYLPHIYSGARLAISLDGRPRFTWLEAERMRLDPQIQFGLRILRAPLWGVTWKIRADRASVEGWIDRQFSHVYRRLLPRLVRMFEYGVAAGEVTFRARRHNGKTRVHFNDFLELHPRDARPLVYERGARAGKIAGMHVKGGNSGSGSIYLDRRHSFWLKGEAEFGDWWGRPRLAGPYEPWLEKRGRSGAIDSRRLFYKKGAFKGPAMRYPIGRTDMGSPESGPMLMSNQDIVREIIEKFENGGVLALPNVKGPTGDYLWSWEDPKAFADVAGFLDYPKQLDREILIGFGVPPELVDAATVGSGYSGRAIPAQMFFTMIDEIAALIIEAIDRQIIRPLVRLNFGQVGYEIVPDSLAKLVARVPRGGVLPEGNQFPDTRMTSRPQTRLSRPAKGRVTAVSAGGSKTVRRAAKFRTNVLGAMLEFQHRANEAGNPRAASPYLNSLAKLASDPEGAKKVRLSWVAAESSHNTVKAIGEGEHAGRVLYGKEAEAALRAQAAGSGSGGEQSGQAASPTTPTGPDAERSHKRADEILQRMVRGGVATDADVDELSTHLPALSPTRLQHVRATLAGDWKGNQTKPVIDLMNHARALVDGANAKNEGTPAPQVEAPQVAPKHDLTVPDTKSLERAVQKKQLHPGVGLREDSTGKPWVVKARVGKAAQASNEAAAASLGSVADVDVVPVHHVKLNGQDHIVVPLLKGATDLAKIPTTAERRAAIANVPKQQIDSHALFDYAISSSDPNLGNYMLADGGKRLVAIDKEQSLVHGGTGNQTLYRVPEILGVAVEPGRAAVDYVFDRGEVHKMANAAGKMADQLEKAGRKKDAVGVRSRGEVLKQLADGSAQPTAGELVRLGEAADKKRDSKRGFFSRIFG